MSLKYDKGPVIISSATEKGGRVLEHVLKTRVRYSDTDQMGYVHHAKYLEYTEMGRTEYMRSNGYSYAEIEKSGFLLVLTEAHLAYRMPGRYDMEIQIKTRLKNISHAQVTFEYTIENNGDILCESWTRLACTDKEGNLRRIPENIKKALKGEK